MTGFIIAFLLLVFVGFSLWSIRRLTRSVVAGFDRLSDEVRCGVNLLHSDGKITRLYIGNELIEKRLLPSVGFVEPEHTPKERFMLATWTAGTADDEKEA